MTATAGMQDRDACMAAEYHAIASHDEGVARIE
jgi:hypothetical protein